MRCGLLFSLALPAFGRPTSPTFLQLSKHGGSTNRTISAKLFTELEELARIVDISYCVGLTGTGIQKPFQCLSRCHDFEHFELVTTWNTGPLLSDSCGYIALSHLPSPPRIIVAFRGTYSITNTIVDLSTVPQEYVPYPGDDDNGENEPSWLPRIIDFARLGASTNPSSKPTRCENCTVHTGFYTSWLNTRSEILPYISDAISTYPEYRLTLVGHSLGGAVAALAALDFDGRGWDPRITTFGEPRLGNKALMRYIDARFGLDSDSAIADGLKSRFRRVTHVHDPVPMLPLQEWGYHMHGGEIFISKTDLPPSPADVEYCYGDEDPHCISAGSSSLVQSISELPISRNADEYVFTEQFQQASQHGWKWEIPIPARFKLWQLFFAHRDYFWRLGLCVPGGDPRDWFGGSDDERQ